VTIAFDKVSAMRIEQRIPVKKIAHFLIADLSMISSGCRSIKKITGLLKNPVALCVRDRLKGTLSGDKTAHSSAWLLEKK
jgi:hypothetical protein